MAEHLFGMTDTGKVRTNNEDVFLAEELMGGQYMLAGVIDGVGGYEGGEVAAALAKEVILAEMNQIGMDVITQMSITFTLANEEIAGRKLVDAKLSDMACVATLAVVDRQNNLFHYIHVGDTRLYLFRDNSLIKITHDQSFVGFLEDSGRLTEDLAMQHPKRNEINQALGLSSSEELAENYFETGSSPFLPGDQLLICSDGLTDLVEKAFISSVLKAGGTLPEKAQQLIDQANSAGGKDNITVVIVKHEKEPIKHAATQPLESTSFITNPVASNVPNHAVKNTSDTEVPAITVQPQVSEGAYASEANRQVTKPFKVALLALSILCLALVGSLIWLSAKYMSVEQLKPAVAVIPAVNAQQKIIMDSLNSLKGDTLKLDGAAFKGIVHINKPLLIERDSLVIVTSGNLVFQRDTAYNGPAIILSPSCKFVKLTDLVFDGFDTAVISYQNVMELKNVRFIHTKHAVQMRFVFPDGYYVNGRRNYQVDSLLKK